MLLTAILFDEIQHSKPGESLPFIAHSGLVRTHGPAQIGVSELIHQKLLRKIPATPTSPGLENSFSILRSMLNGWLASFSA